MWIVSHCNVLELWRLDTAAQIDLFDSKTLYLLIISKMEEEDSNDIFMCGCKQCKFQTHRQRRIAKDHVSKYGTEEVGQYTACIDAQLQGQGHIPQPDMTPDIHASSMHHRGARQQAMASGANTFDQPRPVLVHTV